MSQNLSDYDFSIPEDLIASEPAQPRDSSKLMVIDAQSGHRESALFRDLPRWLNPGDCIVINTSKVLPCRLLGRKKSGGRADALLIKEIEAGVWTALSSGLKVGATIGFGADNSVNAEVLSLNDEGEYVLRFDGADVLSLIQNCGLPPLPPYISKRKKDTASSYDRERYQTVYAEKDGSIAAPTAGLHFTPELLTTLEKRGVFIARLTLHVGRGTFRPIVSNNVADHVMLPEHFNFSPEEAKKVAQTSASGGRVIAVGTSSMRTLESLARRPEGYGAGEGWTDLFIRPGHEFKIARGLITNFHWPKSTPLLLAAAFLDRERLLDAYQEAFLKRYRLFSYGDAMLILR